MAKRINYAYLISFLNLSDHFSIGGINCWKCFSTYRITPIVVNEKLKSRKKIKQRMKKKYYGIEIENKILKRKGPNAFFFQ